MAKSNYIERFINLNNGLDYSKSIYKNNRTKIEIICSKHGTFMQSPRIHQTYPWCPECKEDDRKNIYNKEIIDKCKEVHNNEYEYPDNQEIYSCNDKIRVICPKHGEFEQKVLNHLYSKNKCMKCKTEKSRVGRDEFIQRSNIMHNDSYDYSLIPDNFILTDILTIICKDHGEFKQMAHWHVICGNGCKLCKKRSKNEVLIENILIENNIKYIPFHTFDDCRNINRLIFDFFLPDHKVCIEYNGIQHYKSVEIYGGHKRYEEQLINDGIKVKYCSENNIDLIIIRYDEKTDVKMSEILSYLKNR